jgi:hypothetical protein
MKPGILLQGVRFLLILLFAYAAFSKIAGHTIFRAQLTKFPVLGNYSLFLSWFIPYVELCIVALLFIPKFHTSGFFASAILLTIFSIFLILMVSFAVNLPCSCGGIIALLSWKQHIFFNLFFLALSVTGISLNRRDIYFSKHSKTKKIKFSA